MKYFKTANSFLEKMMPFITPASLILGVLLSRRLSSFTAAVPWVFAFITYAGSLNCDIRDMRQVLSRPRPIFAAIAFLHILMPAVALLAGRLLFFGNPDYIAGMVIEFAAPTAILSIVWVSIYGGNLSLTLGIILLDTFIAPFLLPITLKLMVGAAVEIDSSGIMADLIWMIVIPACLAMATSEVLRAKRLAITPLTAVLTPLSKLAIIAVISINSTSLAPFVSGLTWQTAGLCASMLLLILAAYFLASVFAWVLKLCREDSISFIYNCGMRNISLGAVLAAQYFSGAVLLPIMTGVLFQQTLAAGMGRIMGAFFIRRDRKLNSEASDGNN